MPRRSPARIDGDAVRFADAEYGVAPGQAAVFYDGDRLLGGGWIAETSAAMQSGDGCRRLVPASCSIASGTMQSKCCSSSPEAHSGETRMQGAWMIPKGAIETGETPADAAMREFEEEIGIALEQVPFPLCSVRQSGGKLVQVFALEGNLDPATLKSVNFEMEWPPKSGRRVSIPRRKKRAGCRSSRRAE